MELQKIVDGCKMVHACDNKTVISTHMEHKQIPTYLSLPTLQETKMLNILSRYFDDGIPTYMHECFSEKFALLFDIDGEAKSKDLKDILKPIYQAVRYTFDVADELSINCLVLSASTDNKMSYHIHWN